MSFEPVAGGYSFPKNVIFDNNHQASKPAPAPYNASPTLALLSSGCLVRRGSRVTPVKVESKLWGILWGVSNTFGTTR